MKDGFLILVVVMIFLLALVNLYSPSPEKPEIDNACVMQHPQELISGKIIHPTFSPVTQYVLTYRGKHNVTNEACEISINVTEGEYERRMYQGDK